MLLLLVRYLPLWMLIISGLVLRILIFRLDLMMMGLGGSLIGLISSSIFRMDYFYPVFISLPILLMDWLDDLIAHLGA